jgi:hypothetical protein
MKLKSGKPIEIRMGPFNIGSSVFFQAIISGITKRKKAVAKLK